MRYRHCIAPTVALLLLIGCSLGDGAVEDGQSDPEDPAPPADPQDFASAASPSQEVGFDPQVGSPLPFCRAWFDHDGADELQYRIVCHSIQGVTAAHIHRGTAKDEGPVAVTLFEDESSTDVPGGELASGTVTRDELGSEAFEAVLADMAGDGAYFNVHTMMNEPGEVRGHIVPTTAAEADLLMADSLTPEVFIAAGSPSQEVGFDPVVEGNPTCVAGFAYDGVDALEYFVHCDNISGVTAAHIHRGSAKQEGPVTAFLLEDNGGSGEVNGELASGTLTREGLGSEAFDSIVGELRTDGAYFNVHTQAHPDGEARGQIIALQPPVD